jgi:hypothetical protein
MGRTRKEKKKEEREKRGKTTKVSEFDLSFENHGGQFGCGFQSSVRQGVHHSGSGQQAEVAEELQSAVDHQIYDCLIDTLGNMRAQDIGSDAGKGHA